MPRGHASEEDFGSERVASFSYMGTAPAGSPRTFWAGLKDAIDVHVAALVQSGDEKWKPGTGEEHRLWFRLVECVLNSWLDTPRLIWAFGAYACFAGNGQSAEKSYKKSKMPLDEFSFGSVYDTTATQRTPSDVLGHA